MTATGIDAHDPALAEHLLGELEALEGAVNYNAWIFEAVRPHLGRRVLEVGAGFGTMTELLGDRDRIVALELLPPYVARLRQRFAGRERVEVVEGDATDADLLHRLGEDGIDSAMSFNVLEHIEDDVSVLRNVRDILPPGGRFACFVPAHPFLYGPMDAGVGHVRRYRAAELRARTVAAGMAVRELRHMNLVGYFAWLLNGRVLRSSGAAGGSRAVRLYDRFVVPVTRSLESRWHPPFGQSLLLVAERV